MTKITNIYAGYDKTGMTALRITSIQYLNHTLPLVGEGFKAQRHTIGYIHTLPGYCFHRNDALLEEKEIKMNKQGKATNTFGLWSRRKRTTLRYDVIVTALTWLRRSSSSN
jgi:hypothetical protein